MYLQIEVRYLINKLVKIDKKEALRYLGHKNQIIDEETDKLLDESMAELKEIVELKYVYKIFDIKKKNNILSFENMINIKSKDLNELLKYSSTPIMVQANAGLPKYQNNTTYYDIDPDEYSREINIMARKGVVIFGGCCGTTPEYIKSIINSLNGLKPSETAKKFFTTATSSS